MFNDWRGTFVLMGKALGAVLLCEAVGILAGWATQTSVTTWYPTLTKPSFTPPNWVFAPVWTVMYALMGIAAFLIWRCDTGRARVRSALVAFGVQLLLNGGWSFAFFGARSPALGLVVILLLWGTLAWTIDRFFRIRAAAGWLLVPYLAWVTYALALNAAIWGLN
ncbi:MAG: TspO/MBR family protein [Salinibacter sp.]|uniref:TspO/MBR family protein n=1 Tax=Salinibacter sp. TaxID=2065818 RepID=UPI0035D4A4C7